MTKLAFTLIVILAGCVNHAPATPDAAVREHPDGGEHGDAAGDGRPKMSDADTACSAEADTCPGDSICIAAACEPAFGRLYDLRDLSISLPATDPNGECWDFGCGAPDPYITIAVDNVIVATTPAVSDQYSATFAGPYTIEPIGGGSLELDAYDQDVADDDFAYGCDADPLTAAQLRARHLTCASGGSTMSFTIEPL